MRETLTLYENPSRKLSGNSPATQPMLNSKSNYISIYFPVSDHYFGSLIFIYLIVCLFIYLFIAFEFGFFTQNKWLLIASISLSLFNYLWGCSSLLAVQRWERKREWGFAQREKSGGETPAPWMKELLTSLCLFRIFSLPFFAPVRKKRKLQRLQFLHCFATLILFAYLSNASSLTNWIIPVFSLLSFLV